MGSMLKKVMLLAMRFAEMLWVSKGAAGIEQFPMNPVSQAHTYPLRHYAFAGQGHS